MTSIHNHLMINSINRSPIADTSFHHVISHLKINLFHWG